MSNVIFVLKNKKTGKIIRRVSPGRFDIDDYLAHTIKINQARVDAALKLPAPVYTQKNKKPFRTDPAYWATKDIDGPIRGCSIESHQEWLWYPETGDAWQKDKFIKEQVHKYMEKIRKEVTFEH